MLNLNLLSVQPKYTGINEEVSPPKSPRSQLKETESRTRECQRAPSHVANRQNVQGKTEVLTKQPAAEQQDP